MTREEFCGGIDKYAETIENIRKSAHALHQSLNQTYGKGLPYGFHLDMVVESVYQYGHLVCTDEREILPLFFGAYYHDSIEDARLTYNDVTKAALGYMDGEQARMAAEIAYALTNDKGRTRAERAGEKYYSGIRGTAFAPFVKMADRLANITFSCSNADGANERMRNVYKGELPHFLEAIRTGEADIRFSVPQEMVTEAGRVLGGE